MTISVASSFSLLAFLLLTTTTAATVTPTATNVLSLSPTPTTAACTSELVSFSACLSYTAAPPNNSSSSASSDCCDNFSEILAAGNGSCLCSLLIDPSIFGFPLNSTRILSLASVCPLTPQLRNVTFFRNFTLQSFCSAIEASPPVLSPGQGYQNYSGFNDLSPGPAPAAAPAPCPFHNYSVPVTDDLSLPPPSPPRSFHFGSFQESSATRIGKPWCWILRMPSRLLSYGLLLQLMTRWFE